MKITGKFDLITAQLEFMSSSRIDIFSKPVQKTPTSKQIVKCWGLRNGNEFLWKWVMGILGRAYVYPSKTDITARIARCSNLFERERPTLLFKWFTILLRKLLLDCVYFSRFILLLKECTVWILYNEDFLSFWTNYFGNINTYYINGKNY